MNKASLLLSGSAFFFAACGLYVAFGVESHLEPAQGDIHRLQALDDRLSKRLDEADKRITSLSDGLNSIASRSSITGSETISLAKTFVFWVPSFDDRTRKVVDAKAAEEKFHEWLSLSFGGWSRWKVEGGERNNKVEDGWFYQVSLPKDKPDITATSLKEMILRQFEQTTIYITENRHK